MAESNNKEITTIKLYKSTKDRLNKLKVHKRESYDEILQKMLEILNLVRINPGAGRARLIKINRERIKE